MKRYDTGPYIHKEIECPAPPTKNWQETFTGFEPAGSTKLPTFRDKALANGKKAIKTIADLPNTGGETVAWPFADEPVPIGAVYRLIGATREYTLTLQESGQAKLEAEDGYVWRHDRIPIINGFAKKKDVEEVCRTSRGQKQIMLERIS